MFIFVSCKVCLYGETPVSPFNERQSPHSEGPTLYGNLNFKKDGQLIYLCCVVSILVTQVELDRAQSIFKSSHGCRFPVFVSERDLDDKEQCALSLTH